MDEKEPKDQKNDALSIEDVEKERKRIRRKKYYKNALKRTVSVLVVVAAVAVLIATLFLPILQISGDSMSPTLENEEIVVLYKTQSPERGDVIGFYFQGKILLKRVIALPEETVVIDENGRVYVEGELLEESYVSEFELGDCDQEFPLKVPIGEYFVLGDKRTNSVDSRSSAIGTIASDEIIGEVFFRVSPIGRFGFMD